MKHLSLLSHKNSAASDSCCIETKRSMDLVGWEFYLVGSTAIAVFELVNDGLILLWSCCLFSELQSRSVTLLRSLWWVMNKFWRLVRKSVEPVEPGLGQEKKKKHTCRIAKSVNCICLVISEKIRTNWVATIIQYTEVQVCPEDMHKWRVYIWCKHQANPYHQTKQRHFSEGQEGFEMSLVPYLHFVSASFLNFCFFCMYFTSFLHRT